jgi:hypothetical protein
MEYYYFVLRYLRIFNALRALSGTTSFQYAKHFVRVRQVENPRISTHKIDWAGLEWRFFAAIYFYRQPPTNLKIMHKHQRR